MNLKYYIVPPTIPGQVINCLEMSYRDLEIMTVLVISGFFVLLANEEWVLLSLLFLFSMFGFWQYKKEKEKTPNIFLGKEEFNFSFKNGGLITGRYEDFKIRVGEAEKIITKYGVSKNNYRYTISLTPKTNDLYNLVIYPSLYYAKNVRDILQAINDNIDNPMPVVFSSQKIEDDYMNVNSV